MRLKFSFLIMLIVYGLSLFLSLPTLNIVGATDITKTFTFEDGVAGNYYSCSDFTMASSSSFGKCTTNYKYQGSKGIQVDLSGDMSYTGYINITYSTSQKLTNYTMYIYLVGSNFDYSTFSFVNKSHSTTLVMMKYDMSGYAVYYWNNGVQNTLQSGQSLATWRRTGFNINDDDGNTSYFYGTYNKLSFANSCSGVNAGYRIDQIQVSNYNQFTGALDYMTYILSGDYSGGGSGIGESYCGVDVSQYATQIGDMYSVGVFSEKSSKNLTSNYGVPLDTSIYAVGLSVDLNQYNSDPDPSNYILYINGNSVGGASCFTPFANNYGNFYILFWDCNVALLNETVTFKFEHDVISTYGWYWTVGQSVYGGDLDNDGDSYYAYEETSTTYSWQWIRLGGIFIPFWLPTTNTITGVDADLGMTFWAGTIQPPIIIDYNYTDSLGLSNWDYKNDTGYIYTIPKVEQSGIVCSYTISSAHQINDYDIWIHFTNATDDGYPFECGDFPANSIPYPDGVYSCIPTTAGKYEFCLVEKVGADHVFTGVNVTAWVIGNWANESYYIYTNPPTTYQFDGYDVIWKYDNPNSYDGAIAMFNEYLQFQKHGYLGNYIAWDIEDSVNEHTQYYNSWGDSAEYWGLFANRTNGYSLACPLHQHNIKLYGIIENKIWVLPSTLAILTANDVGHMGVVIYYQHRFVGTNIAIYIDGIYFQPVGDASSGSKQYIPYTAGTHTVKLILDQNGSLTTVAENTFRVTIAGSGGGGGGGGGGAGGGIIPTLAQPLGSIVGMIITVFCLLTPFLIGGALHLQSGIHPVIYAMTGGLGLAISTIMGLFPVWIPLFVIVCGIIVIVIFYLRGATASSE